MPNLAYQIAFTNHLNSISGLKRIGQLSSPLFKLLLLLLLFEHAHCQVNPYTTNSLHFQNESDHLNSTRQFNGQIIHDELSNQNSEPNEQTNRISSSSKFENKLLNDWSSQSSRQDESDQINESYQLDLLERLHLEEDQISQLELTDQSREQNKATEDNRKNEDGQPEKRRLQSQILYYQADEPQSDEPKQMRNVQKIPIGAIFTPKDKALRSAFIYAVKAHNRFESSRFQIEPIIDVIDTNDAFRFTRQCSPLVKSMRNAHKASKQNPSYQIKSTNQMDLIADYALYMQPDIVHAVYKTMQYLKRDHFVYLYDNEEGPMKLQNILELLHERMPSTHSNPRIDLRIVHRVLNGQDAYQFLRRYQNFRLKQYAANLNTLAPLPESAINYSNDTMNEGEREEGFEDFEDILNIRSDQGPPIYVILNMEAELVAATIRRHMDDIYMNRRNFHYLIINLNIDDLIYHNLTEFGALNITGFRILNKSSLNFRQFISYWKSLDPILWPGSGSKNILTGAALVYDAARLLFESFERILKDQRTESFNQIHNASITNPGINCAQVSPLKSWSHGKKTFQQLRKTTMEGLTGQLAFGPDSKRTNYTVEIIQTTMNSELTKIAEYHYTRPSISYNQYDEKFRFNPSRPSDKHDKYDADNFDKSDVQVDDPYVEEDQYGKLKIVPANFQRVTSRDSTLENKTYIVVSILEAPFLMKRKAKPGEAEPVGNDRFIGYCKDLTELIAEQLNINYELKLVADGKYGGRNESIIGGFNGMVGELIRKEADLAIAPLTITSAREKVIQFSKPFLSLGISILFKKPERKSEGSFSFMNPLSKDIWLFILLSYSLVSLVLYLVSRCSPSEVRKVLSAPPTRRGHYHKKKNSIPPIQQPDNYLDDLVDEYGQHYLHYQDSNNGTHTRFQPSNNVIYTDNQFEYQLNNRQQSFNENNHSASNLPTSTSNETYFENEIISPSATFNLENLDETDDNEDKNGEQDEVLYINEFNLVNSMWFTLGAVLQQGVDVCPRSYSGRIVGSVWWFFTLIIISSYTANLAAFLTVERMVTPINSADDLAKQTEVEYVQVYRRMWEFMASRPHVFVETYAEGIKRVRESKGKYAFLMESTQAEYINEKKPCDTMKVGRNLDAKGFVSDHVIIEKDNVVIFFLKTQI